MAKETIPFLMRFKEEPRVEFPEGVYDPSLEVNTIEENGKIQPLVYSQNVGRGTITKTLERREEDDSDPGEVNY